MARTIIQKVIFKNTDPRELYNLYMDAAKHSEATGAKAEINGKVGSKFSSYDQYASGKNIHLLKNKMIVQTWRASDWDAGEPDSVFMINFELVGKDAVLHVVHANLPDSQADSIAKGWNDFYWKPWKTYLEKKLNTKTGKK